MGRGCDKKTYLHPNAQRHFPSAGTETTMSAFGKFKNIAPPLLPRRKDDSAEPERQHENEDEDEYGGMYEVPPFERTITVQQIAKEENVYLERMSSYAPRQRQAPPPPSSSSKSGDALLTSQNIKPPDVNRTAKPGKKNMAAPPPPPAEDIYLDPSEEQEDSEDLYLEPEACSLPAKEPKMKLPFFKQVLPSPEPMKKPSLPPEKSSSPTATAPEVEAKRFSLPKSPPPIPGKPRAPTNQKESRPDPPVLEKKPVASFGGGRVKSPNENREWFAGDCNRKMAEDLLLSIKKDGAFLIRNSSTHSSHQPYTLAVLFQHKVYNIPVRFLDDAQGYALGKEGKKNEEVFNSLDEMISHHKNHKLLLIDSRSQAKHTTYLTHATHL
ncbi:SH2 domain-containing protein 6 isoform X2 [Boleophthalmus pectinirostris]|uniref:SH2 domain-containing protein 6 isoform X2 n=1 Tax=Boleophthalmus pectinirostris TaxID=150288 RepID=UPI00242CD70C|nr:SH2 domain-containing protein 6 isoform X2 [Boleophthalmus pectinirostris]